MSTQTNIFFILVLDFKSEIHNNLVKMYLNKKYPIGKISFH